MHGRPCVTNHGSFWQVCHPNQLAEAQPIIDLQPLVGHFDGHDI